MNGSDTAFAMLDWVHAHLAMDGPGGLAKGIDIDTLEMGLRPNLPDERRKVKEGTS